MDSAEDDDSGSVPEGGGASAVDGHDGAGHERRLVRREERRDARHFLGLGLTADGLEGGVRFPPRLGGRALGRREGRSSAAHVGVEAPARAKRARELVEEPGRVRVEEWTEDGVVHLDLEVAPDDRGRVIGRQGRTADALRTLLEAVGRRRGIECDMEVVD